MTYLAFGSDGMGDLGMVLLVLNAIALVVFGVTLGIDAIARAGARVQHMLHKTIRVHRSPR